MGFRRDERRVMGTTEPIERDQEKTTVASGELGEVVVRKDNGIMSAEAPIFENASIIDKVPSGDHLSPRFREVFEDIWREHEASFRYLAGR